ncbi:uncharacterized protein N0V89_011754 [Didymosphaeria variabile]|uniref:Uncharacterized protein n=1 Tax=Didymosphaeria variabile TaxID=1932322 RepID=A0A9W8XAB6_9PLEO|nr:uncharacterized protein N0V89_011754 [Didymosphaeria variabile]KAJ4345620.1 hypothetical protein N0V89_011754 [Didymosphaeria variabile]
MTNRNSSDHSSFRTSLLNQHSAVFFKHDFIIPNRTLITTNIVLIPTPTPIPVSTLSTSLRHTAVIHCALPMPTEIVPPKHKTPILPILIPCALAAVGIVAFAIWWTMWRSRGQRQRLPSSVDMEPKVIGGQKVLKQELHDNDAV